MSDEINITEKETDDTARSVIILKLKEGTSADDIIKRFEAKYHSRSAKTIYYPFSRNNDTDGFEVGHKYTLFAIAHDGTDPTKIFLGECTYDISDYEGKTLRKLNKIQINYASEINNTAKNLFEFANIDLRKDFKDYEYCIKEDFEQLCSLIKFITTEPEDRERKENKEYQPIPSEEGLHPLAQRNEYCRRQYDIGGSDGNRGEFQKDYERIIHSKAFRRMVDKAQVFSAAKGDYYRTRMTHSQVVAQIARSIAAELRLNIDLTEAAALGHDLGHTPFGHQGERTLNAILNNKIPIIKNADRLFKDHFGGFKHNFQSLRVTTLLEEEYFEIEGMDLSYQTLEGMLKHTKTKERKTVKTETEAGTKTEETTVPICTLSDFMNDPDAEERLDFANDFCSTLEGQVVAIADEIAQRGHDLDDALSSGMLTIDELEKNLKLKKLSPLKTLLDNVIGSGHSERFFPDKKELIHSRISSEVIHFFITDVVDTFREKMSEDAPSFKLLAEQFNSNGHRITEEVIKFSEDGERINDHLKMLIENRVINSPDVVMFDYNGAVIVEGLFRTYYNNPRLLHNGTKRRIMTECRRIAKDKNNNIIDLTLGNSKAIIEEFKMITQTDLSDDNTDLSDEIKEEYKIKRKVLVRNICDYIAGMTDTYALSEFKRIEKSL